MWMDRQTYRQAGIQADIHTDRHTYRQTDRHTGRQADMTKLIVTFHNMQTCLKTEKNQFFLHHNYPTWRR